MTDVIVGSFVIVVHDEAVVSSWRNYHEGREMVWV